MKTLTKLTLILTLISCGIGMNGTVIDPQGIYECVSKTVENAPVYRFDTNDDRTIVTIGEGAGIEFYDLNSGKTIFLVQDNFNYNCSCVEQCTM